MHQPPKNPHHLPDTKQTAWQLAAIQLSGWTTVPILATSILILQGNSYLGAVLTTILGNAIIWFIRLGIISMSYEKRQSTLDISRDYMGSIGNFFIAILLMVSTFAWFIVQTKSGSDSITKLLPINENPDIDQFIQVSVFFGIISTLFCMGGIKVLRKLSTFAFPLLVVWFFAILFTLPDRSAHANTNELSLSGLTLVLATNLGFTADLPTFFRHSKSWKTSIKALTILQLVSLALGLLSLHFGAIFFTNMDLNYEAILGGNNHFLRLSMIGFIFLSVLCANVANVYSASVGWEFFAPKALVGSKEYFILGLGLTTIFILFAGLFSANLLLQASDSALVNLSIVLLLGYVISQRVKKMPNFYERNVYFAAWVISTALNTLQYTEVAFANFSPVLMGMMSIIGTLAAGFLIKRLPLKRQDAR